MSSTASASKIRKISNTYTKIYRSSFITQPFFLLVVLVSLYSKTLLYSLYTHKYSSPLIGHFLLISQFILTSHSILTRHSSLIRQFILTNHSILTCQSPLISHFILTTHFVFDKSLHSDYNHFITKSELKVTTLSCYYYVINTAWSVWELCLCICMLIHNYLHTCTYTSRIRVDLCYAYAYTHIHAHACTQGWK